MQILKFTVHEIIKWSTDENQIREGFVISPSPYLWDGDMALEDT